MDSPKLSTSFFKMASFTLIILSIIIFFGSIYLTMTYLIPSMGNFQQIMAASNDITTKAFLTAIFVLLFALILGQNYIILLLEKIYMQNNKID